MLKIKNIKDVENVGEKTILIRCDFNVPIKDGEILSDFRLKAIYPDLKYLSDAGCKVALCGHLDKDQKVDLILKYFQNVFPEVEFLGEVTDQEAKERIENLNAGSIGIFENLRFNSGEKENSDEFAEILGGLADVYINNAFSASHREHASIVKAPKYAKESCIGELFAKEVLELSKLFSSDLPRPFLFALGGAKFSTKLPLIEKYLNRADQVFVGGALSNNFFLEQGFEIGVSMIEETDIDLKKLLTYENLILPNDVLVFDQDKNIKQKIIGEILPSEAVMDMGSDSLSKLFDLIRKSEFIVWNGPFGNYEEGFSETTKKTLEFLKKEKKKCILGGGDTAFWADQMDMDSSLCFISTGGGAMLEFLDKQTLPGIEVLR